MAARQQQTRGLDGLPPIKVVGVGGGGCNAVNRMVDEEIPGVQFVAINTDAQALGLSRAHVTLRIGDKLTHGYGVGGDPSLGERAAEESRDELLDALKGADMIFITAGMGGGTGTGAAPVVAEVARETGALTIGVVTKPFAFEGVRKREKAEDGIARLREQVDTLIAIPNDKLRRLSEKHLPLEQAFRTADDVLRQGIRGIADVITRPGIINLDFADIRKVMKDAGQALMAIGYGTGENRAADAAKQATTSPLLDVDIHGARAVLFNVTGPADMGIEEIDLAAQIINEVVDPDAEIIFGTAYDDSLGEGIKITLIATGFPGVQRQREELPFMNAEEKIRSLRVDALPGVPETELPTFLRRTVATR